jgi:hypothetical protein
VKVGKAAMEPTKEPINKQQLLDAIENIRLAVMMVYPAYIDLPEWEPTLLLLEERLTL